MGMRAYMVVSSLALVILCTAAFRQASAPRNLGEITVERINVVDANGTLRLVIALVKQLNAPASRCRTRTGSRDCDSRSMDRATRASNFSTTRVG